MCCSIEAYPIPTEFLKPELATEQPLPFLQHSMPGMMFTTGASFSRVRCTRSPSGDVYALSALAKDQSRGCTNTKRACTRRLCPPCLSASSALTLQTTIWGYSCGTWERADSAVHGCADRSAAASTMSLYLPPPRLGSRLRRFRRPEIPPQIGRAHV